MKRFIHLFFILIILSLSFGRLGGTPAQAATGPSATISSNAFNPTNTSPIPVTITFDQPVSGLTLDDLVVGNGTAGNLAGSGEAVSVRYSQVSAGDTHTCGLVSDGSARCWGRNNSGQSTVPALGSGLSYAQVTAGGYNSTSCGLVSDGSLRCWGSSAFGQTSVPVLGSGLTYTQASLSFYHASGLLSNGSVLYWGDEYGGGISHLIVPDSGLIFTQISSGYGHSCALVSDGSVDCWGDLIDDGLAPGGGLTYTQVSLGGIHNCGLVSDGSARCWYMNTYGESTVPALGSGLTYTQVSAGGYHSCGLVSDGSARCWGRNNYGQSTVPALGSGLTYTQVSAGRYHTCSLVSDGSTRCWGQDNYGQSTVPALPVSYSVYTLDITPIDPGIVTVDLPANSAQNLAGDGNTAASQFSIRYSHTVTFNGNGGGTPSPTSKSVTLGSPYGTLATVSRAGYTFNGWYDAASGGTLVTAATVVTTASNHSLYAQWTALTGPDKIAPADTAVDVSLNPMLSWNQLVGATSYEYCYSSAPGPCAKWNSVDSDTSVTLSGLAPNYTYYWQVRAVNPGGTTEANGGAWWSFTTTAALACSWPAYTPPATPTFSDVPVTASYWSWVERLANTGITAGCAAGIYCPFNEVNRAQMAIFLLRARHCGSSYVPPAVGASTGFSDVPLTASYAPWVKQLAAEGITTGCGGGNYCPGNPVIRAQMAIFLLRAKHGSTYSPPAVGATTGFGDVPLDASYAAWVKQLAAEGVTAGCGGGNFCPGNPVTRAQMAIFLVRAFSFP